LDFLISNNHTQKSVSVVADFGCLEKIAGLSFSSYSSGSFSTSSQIPVGQAPAQKPQPMHLSSLTLYSN
jgi:hypothetical protein